MEENNDKLQKINQALSQKDFERRISQSLMSRVKNRSKALLIDVSGSMGESIKTAEGYTTRYSIMLGVLQSIDGYRKFQFSDWCKEILDGQKLSSPDASTNMHGAFDYVKRQNINHVILVTDGQPDSEHLALDAAKDLTVDILYIGNPPTPPFLEKLANASKGSFQEINLISAGAKTLLTSKIKGLLGA